MPDHLLRDLGEIVNQIRAQIKLYDYEDIRLSPEFKKAFSENVAAAGNRVEYRQATAVITNASGQKIYAPNQWFVLAAWPVPLIREIVKYRTITEQMLETYQMDFIRPDGTPMEKKDIYKGLKSAGQQDLRTKFENCMIKYLQRAGQTWEDIRKNTKLLLRFVTDDKWWLGGKGIERTNDFYLSPVLGTLNLVNASQSYVATITYAYVNDDTLYTESRNVTVLPPPDTIHTDNVPGDTSQKDPADSHAYISPVYNTYFETDYARNRIVFGAPGTGKSYQLQQEAGALLKSAASHMERVTFHSDYTYSQLAGCYKPVTDASGEIRYEFVPGPFMRVYVNAMKNSQQITKTYQLLDQAENIYMFPTNPNPPGAEEKWDLFEEITHPGQTEYFQAPRNSGPGDLALIYVSNAKPEYVNGIYAIGTIIGKPEINLALIRFDYISCHHPVVDYETLKPFHPNIRSYGRVSQEIADLVRETILPASPFLLLIEEINRARAASVFGDIFQLLDRDESGVSEYEIQTSEEIRNYLARELGGTPDNWASIRLPDHMFIWSTMNSADQGVFPMDTAFKRRWDFEYLGINDGEDAMNDGTVVLGRGTHAMEIRWNQLRKAINEKLAAELNVNEDKLMGPFFLSGRAVHTMENGYFADQAAFIRAFRNKVLMYLYEDAARQYRHKLFAGCDARRYSSICEAFDRIGIEIFGPDFTALYRRQETE